ncbi:DUF350 domain-containing protein [Saccharibacillus sp. CPCC 101409]|uniref:DUF350 domain-containing protein n=1 Tax=Saccharibacillus sp. CPCC 101409 TaxID=3058041 RepID=UPI002672578A|nr:DUF350 domain-containing protein [Saccharibacillus sp. CPCC 101409]MDO3412164.1 DUF350 domain-containing protein [Saccharibacillus sp. CPCC 101409]
MEFSDLARLVVWTLSGAVLLTLLMFIDSLFTKYKDFQELKKGNLAVTVRLVMKIFAQGFILTQVLERSPSIVNAWIVSFVSFVILLLLESAFEFVLKKWGGLNLDEGTERGNVAHGLFAGTLHVVGALIIVAAQSI